MKNKLNTLIILVILGTLVFVSYRYLSIKRTPELKVNAPANVIETVKEVVPATELLGKAEVSFAGGTEERNKNIELGVSKINGKVIMPGEEFSFTKVLGPVTEEGGYSEAKVFLNGEVTKGLGGGLCQVSTTLFQSLLKAGLPITERHNHSYTVSYYDVGLDATYSDPGPDLKFVNDTSNPITIKGKTEDKKVVFEIYGVSDGRVASTSEAVVSDVVDFPPTRYVATTTKIRKDPDCMNTPQIGYTAKIIHEVIYPNGEIKSEDFVSKYKPLQRVCYFYATSTTAVYHNYTNTN